MKCNFEGEYSSTVSTDLFDYSVKLTDIVYLWDKSEKGSRDSLGIQLEPDYNDEIDFVEADAVIKKEVDGRKIVIDKEASEYSEIYLLFIAENAAKIEQYIRYYNEC